MDFDDPFDDHDGPSFSLANWQRQLTEDAGPYEAVCFKLASSCGAIPLGSFLSGEYQDLDLQFHQRGQGKETTAKGPEKTDGEPSSAVKPDGDFESPWLAPTASLPSLPPLQALPPQEALDVLHQTCIRLTGADQALDYDVVEAQSQCFECILTVTSLIGTKRAYKSGEGRPSIHEAKQEAAKVAVEMGVVDFIRTGDSDVSKHKKAELIARAKIESKLQEACKPPHPSIQQIEDCCLEWRAGKVVPNWAYYRLTPQSTERGASLRLALSLHQAKSYSSDARYESKEQARAACAEIAIEEGVLDYIKYGNGQTSPPPEEERSSPNLVVAQRLSLLEYFEGLPRPFPVDSGNTMNVSDLHPVSRLNILVQNSRVPRLKINYYGTNS
ncbi:hypothetical protein BKA70DRAFT_1226134 [Coprinopsis sp. MPI-PUGE-AT-0042]|nr:hypothetical protein BKA70DRAFT_1226134 [Coprinopsis sp. MPI-PUGE-AT-0042]